MNFSIIAASRLRASAAIGDFIITVNSGSGSEFTIPTNGSGYNYGVTTSDGQTFTGQTGNLSISFPASNTVYTINISGSFPLISIDNGSNRTRLLSVENFGIYSQGSSTQLRAFFNSTNLVINASDSGFFGSVTDFTISWTFCSSLTSFPLIDTGSGSVFRFTWRGCTSLTSFPLIDTSSGNDFTNTWLQCTSLTSFPLIDTSSATDFNQTWYECSSLTSFPLIDTSSVTNFNETWRGCNSLTSFPLIDTSGATNFLNMWYECRALTSFPLIDTSSVTDFNRTWFFCSALTSFPLIDTSSATRFNQTWNGCSSLVNFPANAFDSCIATNFNGAFFNTNLSQASIDGILVSINSNGISSGVFTQSGGNAPSSTGESAITAMRSRGWSIVVTGGF